MVGEDGFAPTHLFKNGFTDRRDSLTSPLPLVCCMPRAHLLSSSRFRILYTGCRSLPVQHSFGSPNGCRTRFSGLKVQYSNLRKLWGRILYSWRVTTPQRKSRNFQWLILRSGPTDFRDPVGLTWWCQIDSNYLFGLMRPKSAPCGVTSIGGRYVNRTHYFAVLWSCSPSPYHPGHRPICLTPLILLSQATAVTPHAVSVC